ncbi:hypothetical protein GCM10010519_11010 [Streptomyces lactacystinicus]
MRIRSLFRIPAVILTAVTSTAFVGPARASTPPLSLPRVVAHLDLAQGRQPENLTLLPGGLTAVTFAFSRQVAEIDCHGRVRVIATLPAPAPGATTPVLQSPFLGGIVSTDSGVLYFLYATGTADLTGVWRLSPGGVPERIAALPADGLPNGLALDDRTGDLFAADSVLGTVWRIPADGGSAVPWATGGALNPSGFLGANGLKVHNGAVWVSNLDQGTLLRFPIRPDGTAGPAQVAAADLPGIDDFAFTGHGNQVLAALNASSQVVLVTADGKHTVVLDHGDGLENPTSVAVRGERVWVADAAYLTRQDPNLLTARLRGSAAR